MILKNPLVSFCITTYKRSDFLKTTIESILNQKNYSNIEIVINDNDEKGSAKSVIDSINDNRIIYHKTEKNEGMVKGFNKAFSLSKGDFIVFMSDDDPPTEDMLETLINLYYKNPDCVGYFGTCNRLIKQENGKFKEIETFENHEKLKGNINVYKTNIFLNNLIQAKIFEVFLWSAGFVKRDIVEKIGGVPDYGYANSSDVNYLVHIADTGDICVINKKIGNMIAHGNNTSVSNGFFKDTYECIISAHNNVIDIFRKYNLENLYLETSSNYNCMVLLSLFVNNPPHTKDKLKYLMDIFTKLIGLYPTIKKKKNLLLVQLYIILYFDSKIFRYFYYKYRTLLNYFNITTLGLFNFKR